MEEAHTNSVLTQELNLTWSLQECVLLKIISWWIATDALWTGWTNFSKEYLGKARYSEGAVTRTFISFPKWTLRHQKWQCSAICANTWKLFLKKTTVVTFLKDHMFLEIKFLLLFFIKSQINWDSKVVVFFFSHLLMLLLHYCLSFLHFHLIMGLMETSQQLC